MSDLTPRVRRLLKIVADEAYLAGKPWWEELNGVQTIPTQDVRTVNDVLAHRLTEALKPFKKTREVMLQ